MVTGGNITISTLFRLKHTYIHLNFHNLFQKQQNWQTEEVHKFILIKFSLFRCCFFKSYKKMHKVIMRKALLFLIFKTFFYQNTLHWNIYEEKRKIVCPEHINHRTTTGKTRKVHKQQNFHTPYAFSYSNRLRPLYLLQFLIVSLRYHTVFQ